MTGLGGTGHLAPSPHPPGPPLTAFLHPVRSDPVGMGLFSSRRVPTPKKHKIFGSHSSMVTENMGFGVGFCQSTAPHPSPPTLSASPCGNGRKTVFERVWWPLLQPCPRCVHSTSARRANKKIVVRRRCRQTPLQTSVEVGWQSAPEPRHAQQRASRSNRKRQQPTSDTSGPPNMKTPALDGRNKRNFVLTGLARHWRRFVS